MRIYAQASAEISSSKNSAIVYCADFKYFKLFKRVLVCVYTHMTLAENWPKLGMKQVSLSNFDDLPRATIPFGHGFGSFSVRFTRITANLD